MLHEWFKVFIAIKQQETALYAANRDYGVDGFAHRNSQGSQGAEVPGGLNGKYSDDCKKWSDFKWQNW